jgi:hypothetical protein
MLAVRSLSGKDFLPHQQIETLSKADAFDLRRAALNERCRVASHAHTKPPFGNPVERMADFYNGDRLPGEIE